MHTFIHRTILVAFNWKISCSLQGRPPLFPCEMDLVSRGSGHFSLDTRTPNFILNLVSSLWRRKLQQSHLRSLVSPLTYIVNTRWPLVKIETTVGHSGADKCFFTFSDRCRIRCVPSARAESAAGPPWLPLQEADSGCGSPLCSRSR